MKQNVMNIQIRTALPDDAASIASVLDGSFVEYQSQYTPAGFAATTPALDEIRVRMSEGQMWVALRDHKIIGTVSVVPKGESLYIRGMAILPAARGERIGELLLKQIESFAVEHNYQRLFLSTTPFLSRAIRLYENFGFRRNDEGPHDLFGTPLITMEKTLEDSIEPHSQ